MTVTTYFIHYTPNTQTNYTNALHVWLSKNMPCIYVEEHSWFAVTNWLASDIRDHLLAIMSADDSLLVFTVGPDYSSWAINEKVTEWLKNNWHPGLPVAR